MSDGVGGEEVGGHARGPAAESSCSLRPRTSARDTSVELGKVIRGESRRNLVQFDRLRVLLHNLGELQ